MNPFRSAPLSLLLFLSLSLPLELNAACYDYAPAPTPFAVGTFVQDLAVSGDILFVASFSPTAELTMLNVSDVSNPTVVGTLDLSGGVWDMALHGDWLYILSSGTVTITDVSDPANPSIANTIAVSFQHRRVATDGVNLYCAETSSGIDIWELSNPTTPVFAGSVEVGMSIEYLHAAPDHPGILVTAGDTASGWGSVGLRTIDVSDPQSPFVAGYLNCAFNDQCGSSRVGGFDVSGTMAAISVESSGSCTSIPDVNEMQFVDLSDPTSIQVIDVLPAKFSPEVAFFGEAGELHWMWGDRLFQVDVSSPPVFPVGAPRSMAYEDLISPTYLGDGWAVGSQGADLVFFDVRPLPGLLGTTDIAAIRSKQRYQNGVLAANDRIYVATTSLDIYDSANPQALTLLSSTPVPLSGGASLLASSIAVSGDLLFLAGAALQILDITDVSAPVLIGTLPGMASTDIEVVGTTAYLVDDQPASADLVLVDISDPTLPVEIDRINTGSSSGIAYWNQSFYQPTGGGEFLKIPLHPSHQVTSTDTFGGGYDVTIVNGIAYVPTYLGLSILDVEGTAAKAPPGPVPVEIGTLAIEGGCRDLVHMGDHLFVTAPDWESVYVVDVTDPTNPILRPQIAAPAHAIAASAEFVVTADSRAPTLYLFAPQCGPAAVSSPARTTDLNPNVVISPNPFHGSASIAFSTQSAGRVPLDVYDVAGRHIRTILSGSTAPGQQRATWDGRDKSGRKVASGTYFVRVNGSQRAETARVVLIR